ncbi:MAG: amidohydrolase family protein [bacterium]|nr:amidohydrolase family protein [bacterium]
MNNNRETYLADALALKPEEASTIERLSEWLPQEIIDCHAHSNLPQHVEYMTEKTSRHMLSTFPSFTIEESQKIRELFYLGKRVRYLRFPKTFRGINHRMANEYLLTQSPKEDRIALFGLPEDIEYTTSMLHHPRVSALKMYYSYVEPTATAIYQFFRPEILEVAQSLNIPIILHLPRPITQSADDLGKLVQDFPHLRVTLAHLGLTKVMIPGLEIAYRRFSKYPQIMMDTALCPSTEVVEASLRIFGDDRIMFGSDEPLHLIRSRPYIHPQKGQRIITEYPYHWVDPMEHATFGHLAVGAIHCHWLSMEALRLAVSKFPKRQQDGLKRRVFCENAQRFYGF